jgi:hypothetical protein
VRPGGGAKKAVWNFYTRLAEMQRLHEQMAHDQEDIDRLRAETKALLAALQAA